MASPFINSWIWKIQISDDIKKESLLNPQSSKNITFNEAKSFMRSRCKNIEQTLLDGQTMNVDGYDVYVFLHGRGGKYCISMVNTFVLEVKAVHCGGEEKKRQYWNL